MGQATKVDDRREDDQGDDSFASIIPWIPALFKSYSSQTLNACVDRFSKIMLLGHSSIQHLPFNAS